MPKQSQEATHTEKKGKRVTNIIPIAAGVCFLFSLFLFYQSSHLSSSVFSASNETVSQNQHQYTLAKPRIEIDTDVGSILIELYPEHAAPVVNELIELSKSGYYNNNTFLESMPPIGFVIAKIGPSIKSFKLNAQPNKLTSVRGSVAISKMAIPKAYLNNLFVGFQPREKLQDQYIIIGQVLKGLEIIEQSQSGTRYRIKSFNVIKNI